MDKSEASNVIDKMASSFHELSFDRLQPYPVVLGVCSYSVSVRMLRVTLCLIPVSPMMSGDS